MEPVPPAVEAQSLQHWSTREVPGAVLTLKALRAACCLILTAAGLTGATARDVWPRHTDPFWPLSGGIPTTQEDFFFFFLGLYFHLYEDSGTCLAQT